MHKKKSASYFRGDLWYKEQVDRRTREALDRLQSDFAREHGMDSTERLLQYLRAQDQALGPLASPGEVIGGMSGWEAGAGSSPRRGCLTRRTAGISAGASSTGRSSSGRLRRSGRSERQSRRRSRNAPRGSPPPDRRAGAFPGETPEFSEDSGPLPVSYGRIRGRQLNKPASKEIFRERSRPGRRETGRATNGGETWSNAGRQLHRNRIGVWREGAHRTGLPARRPDMLLRPLCERRLQKPKREMQEETIQWKV